MGGRSPKGAPVLDIDTRLTQLDSRLQKLQSLYEQHFTGVVKREPLREHQEFKSAMNSISGADLKTTAAKFRFQSIQSRYLQMSTLWGKILKQMEEGTYKRDLFLLEKKHAHDHELGGQTKTPATPSAAKAAIPKAQKHLDMLYEKMASLISKEQKLPQKEAFISTLEKQISAVKEKNPDKKIELKLQKNSSGKIEVKIKTVAKTK